MKHKIIYALIVGSLIAANAMNAYAADEKSSDDDNTVVGACMVQKFKERTPAIAQSVIDKCADAEADAIPKCLGLSEDEYLGDVAFCIAQLKNAKCVATKMKVTLIDYASCGYESDPVACYKGLGYTPDQIVKLSDDCQK